MNCIQSILGIVLPTEHPKCAQDPNEDSDFVYLRSRGRFYAISKDDFQFDSNFCDGHGFEPALMDTHDEYMAFRAASGNLYIFSTQVTFFINEFISVKKKHSESLIIHLEYIFNTF